MGNNLIRMRGKTPKYLPEKSAGLSRDAPGNALSRQGAAESGAGRGLRRPLLMASAAHGEPEDYRHHM